MVFVQIVSTSQNVSETALDRRRFRLDSSISLAHVKQIERFELQVPTYNTFSVHVDEEDIPNVLGSITCIDRSKKLWPPVLLYRPASRYTSPRGTFVADLTERDIQEHRGLRIVHGPGLKKVVVIQPERLEATQTVRNGEAYTILRGQKVPLESLYVKDDTILVNEEGAFLINLIEGPNGKIKPEESNGVLKVPAGAITNYAFGTANIVSALREN